MSLVSNKITLTIINLYPKVVKGQYSDTYKNQYSKDQKISNHIVNKQCLLQKQKLNPMFKKRTLNKESNNTGNNDGTNEKKVTFEKRPVNSGIDLRKDIEEMEQIISTKKDKEGPAPQDNDGIEQHAEKHQNPVFKTKRINKFTSHILKNLPTRTLDKQTNLSSLNQAQVSHNLSQIPKPKAISSVEHQNSELFRPNLSNYGLLDKSHFGSGPTQTNEPIDAGKTKNHQEALMDYYIKKRMEQMTKPSNPIANKPFGGGGSHPIHRQPQAWQEVLQIQKQYLTQEEKIKEYSMQEIQKKLQKLAQETIRTEIQKRNTYLKDLLQNEYERMEYASKKELKIMKQEKERIERDLNSKYRDSGRRNFIENIKNQVL